MKNHNKSSFTLIELIFAIVIIGIVITSIPMLLATTTKIQATSLKEKSFFNAYSLINLLQTQAWDENNTKGDNYYKVLTADNGDSELKCIRKGVKELNNHSGADCATDNNKTSPIGPDKDENSSDDYDDIDDFNGYSSLVNEFNFSVSVKYIKDEADYSKKNIVFSEDTKSVVTATNLKFIEVNVTTSCNKPNELIVIINYISSNIGRRNIESRQE